MYDRDIRRAAQQAQSMYLASVSVAALLRKAVAWVATAVSEWRQRSALRAELSGLSDFELSDIGLVRSDIEALVQGRYRDERPVIVPTPAKPKPASVIAKRAA